MNPTTNEANVEPTAEPIHPFRTYGQYTGDPTSEQLQTYFTLEPRDLEIIATRRRDDTRLGMALQLCTLRFLGTFLDDPTAVPQAVLSSLSQQLQLSNVNLERYRDSDDARLDHRRLLTQHLEYRAFEGAPFLRVGECCCKRCGSAVNQRPC